jgi:hypothetical protein
VTLCPYCDSAAVRAMRRDALEDGQERVLLWCGECATWRGAVLSRRAGEALARAVRRDARRMARMLSGRAGTPHARRCTPVQEMSAHWTMGSSYRPEDRRQS